MTKASPERTASKKGISIGIKMIGMIITAVLITITTVELVSYTRHKSLTMENKAAVSEAISMLTAGSAGGALRFKKTEALDHLFAEVAAAQPDSVTSISAFDPEGSLIYSYPPSEPVSGVLSEAAKTVVSKPQYLTLPDHLVTATPVFFGPKKQLVGVLVFDWDDSASNAALEKAGMTSAMIGLLVGIAISIALAFGIRAMIVMPLKRLAEQIENLASGTQAKVLYRDRGDEIGLLARSTDAILRQSRVGERLRISLDSASAAISIADDTGKIAYANKAFEKIVSGLKGFENITEIKGHDLASIDASPRERRIELEKLNSSKSDRLFHGGRIILRETSPILDSSGQKIGIVSEWWDRTDIERIEIDIARVAEAAANGEFSERVKVEGTDTEQAELAGRVNQICESSGRFLESLDAAVERLAHGDLTKGIEGHFNGRFEAVAQNLDSMLHTLAPLIHQVKTAGSEIDILIDGVRKGAGGLAERAEQQAAALRDTASSMADMAKSGEQSAALAETAKETASTASSRAEAGGETVAQTVSAMREIEAKSSKITEITSVIETIAFQTNLLALNASVEAARAGDHGKGFAVVANEVRSLADRAKGAASDIKSLIEQTHHSVVDGGRLVDSTGEIFGQIVETVRSLADSVDSISEASSTQKRVAAEMGEVIGPLDSATQHNASLAQDSANRAAQLTELSAQLTDAVNRFQIGQPEAAAEKAA